MVKSFQSFLKEASGPHYQVRNAHPNGAFNITDGPYEVWETPAGSTTAKKVQSFSGSDASKKAHEWVKQKKLSQTSSNMKADAEGKSGIKHKTD